MGNSSSTTTTADHHQLESLLEELCDQLWNWEMPSDASAAGLWKFLQWRSHKIDYQGLHMDRKKQYLNQVMELKRRWEFLKVFIDGVKKCSDADEVVENCGSVIVKVESKANELVKLLSSTPFIQQQKSSRKKQRSSSFMMMMMDELQARADEFVGLNGEITRVLNSILGSFSSVKILSPLHDLSLWIKFAESTLKLMSVCYRHLEQLRSFIRHVHHGFQWGLMLISGDQKVVIQGFFAHVAQAGFRVFCLCILSLVGSTHPNITLLTNEVIDEISFANPKFLDLTLKIWHRLNK